MRHHRRILSLLAVTLLLPWAVTAQTNEDEEAPKEKPNAAPAADPAVEEGGLAIPSLDTKHEILVRAAAVEPIDPERVKALVPDKLAGMTRTRLEGKLVRLGKAGMTKVWASYVDDAGRGVDVEITDPGGMPLSEPVFLPLIPAGTTRAGGGAKLEGLLVDGHPSVLETPATSKPARLQVGVGARMRVTLKGHELDGSQLSAVASDLNLSGLASLAP